MRLRKFAQISTSEEEEEEEMSNEHEEGEILPPEEDEDEEASLEDPKPVGKRVRFSGEGSEKKSHYKFFEFSGNRYTIVSDFFLDKMNGFRRFVFELKVLVFLFSVFRVKAGKKLGLAFGLLAFFVFFLVGFWGLSIFLG
jgi:cobalamin biosynthesis protein CobT